jgi:RND family efflux transporter MFP subunit
MNPKTLLAAIALASLVARAGATEYSAVLDWSQRVDLAPAVPGIVASVSVQPGQWVKADSLLAQLNATAYQASVVEARADLERLSEEATEARRDLERVQELYARTVSSTTELDAAKLRHARANAQLAAGQAKLERAGQQQRESEVRAPFDAIVLARRAEPGMAVSPQCQPPALLTVARADEMIARAMVEASKLGTLKLGATARVAAGGGTYSGTLRAITAVPEGKYALDFAFPRPPNLPAGLNASVRLP